MAKQQKRKSRPSWFQKQLEKNGENFLLRKPPMEIQREYLNILRDITRGNVTSNELKYLFDLKVLSNIKISLFNKYIELHVYDSTLSYVLQELNGVKNIETIYKVAPENLQKVFNDTRTELAMYCELLTVIDTMINFVQTPYPKPEESYLQVYSSVQNQISKFRYKL